MRYYAPQAASMRQRLRRALDAARSCPAASGNASSKRPCPLRRLPISGRRWGLPRQRVCSRMANARSASARVQRLPGCAGGLLLRATGAFATPFGSSILQSQARRARPGRSSRQPAVPGRTTCLARTSASFGLPCSSNSWATEPSRPRSPRARHCPEGGDPVHPLAWRSRNG